MSDFIEVTYLNNEEKLILNTARIYSIGLLEPTNPAPKGVLIKYEIGGNIIKIVVQESYDYLKDILVK